MISNIINGRPTRTQVDKLFARVKELDTGGILPHAEIAALTGEAKGSNRYRTVIGSAKRRILSELGVVMIAERGQGYRKATGYDQIRHGVGSIGAGIKKVAKGVHVVAAVADDRLESDTQRKVRDFIVERATCLTQIAKANRKELDLTVGKPEVLPQ